MTITRKNEFGLLVPNTLQSFRKDSPPTKGEAFNFSEWGEVTAMNSPGAAAVMFDVSKLNLSDYRAMRWHPQVNASLTMISFMLHQMDWKIESSNKKLAAAVEENLRVIWTRLIRSISQSLWAGFSPSVLEWDDSPDGRYLFVSKVKDLYPEECQVNWKLVDSGYRPPSQYTFIPPKVKVFDGIKKFGLNYPIPTDHSFWYPLMMENGDYFGRKLLKAAFQPWYFSLLIHLYSNRYFERFGEPVPIGRAPFEDDFPVKQSDGTTLMITGKQAMEQMLLSLRNRGIVTLPSDRDPTASSGGGRSEYIYDIEYLESQMRGADFERYMARLDEEISLAIFTPMLLMRTGDVGSNALGVQHTQTWMWALNALAGDIKEYIDRYIVNRIKGFNFSSNAEKVEWVPKKMGKENVETLRAIITALISGNTATVDLEEMGVALGMTLKEVKVAMDPQAQAAGNQERDVRDRQDRIRSTARPQGLGEPMATGRQIAARIREQAIRQFKDGSLGKDAFSLGYRRRFIESLEAEGVDAHAAERMTDSLYAKMDTVLKTAAAFGVDEFTGAEDFVELFQRRLTKEIEDLGTSGE
jgi:hypothetical protein